MFGKSICSGKGPNIFAVVSVDSRFFPSPQLSYTEAKFLVPDWGDIVDVGIGLPYRPASLCGLVGRYDNLMPESTISPH
jgi:hypothetical protein